ncbi:uncharacterized protein PAC_12742 [Phialocephala subalpina]|uniref:Uncharacterized protein n=1 Tax=Phialocephala subalpina TaxID=576137 RepID=A0A1L7XCU3_9HELO|nr:uncharacterized protein PAC_12742 [Phialocephala subalpina]
MDPFTYRQGQPVPISYMAAYCSPRKDNPVEALPPPIPRLRIRGSGPQDTNTIRSGRILNGPGQDTCTCMNPELSFAPVPLENFGSEPPLAHGSLLCRICGKRRGRRPVVHQDQGSPGHGPSYYDVPASQRQDRRRPDLEPMSPDSNISPSYTIISSSRPRRIDQRYTRATNMQFSDDSSFSDISTNPEQERRTSYMQPTPVRDRFYTSPQYDRPRNQYQERNEAQDERVDSEPWLLYESGTTYYKTPATRPRERRQEYFQQRSSNTVHRPLIRDDNEGPSRGRREYSAMRDLGRSPLRGKYPEEDMHFREERHPRKDTYSTDDSYSVEDRYSGEEIYSRERRHSRERWEPQQRDDIPIQLRFDDNFQRQPRALHEATTRRPPESWHDEERSRFSSEVTSDDDFFDSTQVRYVNSMDWPRRVEEDHRAPSRRTGFERDEVSSAGVRRIVVVDGW